MAENDKRYLDEHGLQVLADEGFLAPHPVGETVSAEAYKIGRDSYGHVVLGDKLTAADFGVDNALHFIGISTADPTGNVGAQIIDYNKAFVAGDVCIYKRTGETNYEEYIFTGNAWELLGDADSYAMKDITVIGDGTYITGGGDLSENRTLTHKTYTAEAAKIVAVGRDSGGHVVLGKEVTVQSNVADGGHSHNTSTTIDADTFVTGVTPTNKKLSIDTDTATVVTNVPGASANLDIARITPVSGSTTASKVTPGSEIDIAKAGTAVVYGTADVGNEVSVAIQATAPTKVGNADVGSAVIYGTANVGTAVSIDAGKADVGAEVELATIATAQSTFLTGIELAAPTTTIETNKDVYNASVSDEILILSPVTLSATTTAPGYTPSTESIYGVGGTKKITPAVASNRTVSVTPAVAAPDTQTLTPAKSVTDSSTKIYGVANSVTITPAVAAPNTRKIVPAVANGTITPYTATDVTVPVAAAEITVATGSVSVGGAGGVVMTGLGNVTSTSVVTGASIVKGDNGDVTIVDNVTATKNIATAFEGTTDTHAEQPHTHNLVTD